MGLSYNTYLNSGKIYGCKSCKAHLANHEDIVSRVSFPPGRACFLLAADLGAELPRPARQGVSFPQRRKCRGRRAQ